MQDIYSFRTNKSARKIESIQPIQAADFSQESLERDEQIVQRLQNRLRERKEKFREAFRRRLDITTSDIPVNPVDADHYEPQRITRKICWQYDKEARKVPLFRRHYI